MRELATLAVLIVAGIDVARARFALRSLIRLMLVLGFDPIEGEPFRELVSARLIQELRDGPPKVFR